MKKILGLIVIFFLTNSCSFFVPQSIKSRMFCYENRDGGLDTLINMEGYYCAKEPYDRYNTGPYKDHVIDTFFLNILFFRDGIIAYNFGVYDNDIQQYFQDIMMDKKVRKAFQGNHFVQSALWGAYRIEKDTIKAKVINCPNPPASWYGYEIWFKIRDKNTIQIVDKFPLGGISQSELKKYNESKKDVIRPPAYFISTNHIPSSDCWLKKEKWFWCNKSDWENYMRRKTKKSIK